MARLILGCVLAASRLDMAGGGGADSWPSSSQGMLCGPLHGVPTQGKSGGLSKVMFAFATGSQDLSSFEEQFTFKHSCREGTVRSEGDSLRQRARIHQWPAFGLDGTARYPD